MKIGIKLLLASCSLSLLMGCNAFDSKKMIYASASLEIKQLTPHVYVHTSYLDIPDYGIFPCNGMIVAGDSVALVFDTPANLSASEELLTWIREKLACQVKGVVINHFHTDCLGGLKVFHKKGIPSFANEQTILLAKRDSVEAPQHGFNDHLKMNIENLEVINAFHGKAHSADNIVSYVVDDNVLFGGCMVKAIGAGKGNLSDADTKQWPRTIRKIKKQYKEALIIVPGHGEAGTTELLDYTWQLFKKE